MVYFNGKCLPVEQASIGLNNGGWLHGAGLFETMRAENGRVFRLDKHLDRLCSSAQRLLAPIDQAPLPDHDALGELLERNGLADARVRLTVTAGDILRAADGDESPLTVCATARPLTPYPNNPYEKGFAVLITKYRQSPDDPLAGHKTTSYLGRLVAMNEARQAGCDEALWFTTNNLLAEGCISNVFIVQSGVVATPPLDTPVLPGIARATVLEICAAQGIETAEKPININHLLDADEVFITNVIMQVIPVSRIERRQIGDGKPGPIAKGLLEQYKRRVAQECPSHGQD